MYINGEIYTRVSVESFDVIKNLCEEAGVLERDGSLARVEDDKIVTYELDIFDNVEKRVLYDKPYDVKLASTLIDLYTQAKEYIDLPETTKKKIDKEHSVYESTGDYKTAYRLQLKR